MHSAVNSQLLHIFMMKKLMSLYLSFELNEFHKICFKGSVIVIISLVFGIKQMCKFVIIFFKLNDFIGPLNRNSIFCPL